LNLKVLDDKVGLFAFPQSNLIFDAKHIIAASIFKWVRSIGSGSSPAL